VDGSPHIACAVDEQTILFSPVHPVQEYTRDRSTIPYEALTSISPAGEAGVCAWRVSDGSEPIGFDGTRQPTKHRDGSVPDLAVLGRCTIRRVNHQEFAHFTKKSIHVREEFRRDIDVLDRVQARIAPTSQE